MMAASVSSIALLFIFLACMFDYCLAAYGVLKTVALVVVTAGAAVRSRREQQQMIDWVSYISRRMLSLLILV
jgi:hypothetical protein